MDAEIKLLEDRVQRAVARIRELTAEKARLSEEVRALRADVARGGKETRRGRSADRREVPLDTWADSLREAIRELQGA